MSVDKYGSSANTLICVNEKDEPLIPKERA
jgi:hypothetical protein